MVSRALFFSSLSDDRPVAPSTRCRHSFFPSARLRLEMVIRTQLHNVSNDAHDQETHADSLAYAEEFALVG